MKKLLAKLLQQHTLRRIGALKDVFSHTVFYASAINFILIAITAYWTTLRQFILIKAPWVTFPVFISVLVGIVLVGMLFEYKFVLSSYYKFRSDQYGHDEREERLMKKLDSVLERLGELERKYEETNNKSRRTGKRILSERNKRG